MHQPITHTRTQEEREQHERERDDEERRKKQIFSMFVGYTAQFASEHNARAYVDFSCSQHLESVVSPIFVDNNNEHTHAGNKGATKKRRTINGRHQPSQGKEQTDDEKR